MEQLNTQMGEDFEEPPVPKNMYQWLCRFGWLAHGILAFFAMNYARFEPHGDWHSYRKGVDFTFACFLLLSFIPSFGIGKCVQERFANMAKAFVQSMLVMFAVLWLVAMMIAVLPPQPLQR